MELFGGLIAICKKCICHRFKIKEITNKYLNSLSEFNRHSLKVNFIYFSVKINLTEV
jgi:hypothetical protein